MAAMESNMNYRVPTVLKKKFTTKCKKEGRPHSWVFRELIEAFNEDRLKIQPAKK